MNVTQIKGLTWLFAAGLTGGLFWYVFDYFQGIESREPLWNEEQARELLERDYTTEGPKVDVVALGDVLRTFQQLNWTGREAPPPAPEVTVEAPRVVPRTPVSDLVHVLLIQEDLDRPENSQAFVRYRDAAKVADAPKSGFYLSVGERLAAPHESIRVESIRVEDGITFVFDEDGRAPETVRPPHYDIGSSIVVVDAESAMLPARTSIVRADGQRALVTKQTQLIARDRYALGTEDMFLIADNYPTIIAREVRHRRHRDPRTGRYDGIELQEVKPGGTVARHGGMSGDVIKSVNGHPVTSLSEAITFVKNNKDKYSVWEVVIENMGQARTVVYQTPPSSQP